MLANICVDEVAWLQNKQHLIYIRTKVFIEEQKVPIELEWDDQDATAQHILVRSSSDEAIACARLLNNGSIGRMAVLKDWRGMGVGATLLNKAIEIHRQQGVSVITLSAQLHAILFYKQAGFEVMSENYLDAGIMHVDMQLIADKREHGPSTD